MISLKSQSKKSVWYVNSCFSTHTTRDEDKFASLQEENNGTISFGNDNLAKVIGKGTIKLGSKDVMVEDIFLI